MPVTRENFLDVVAFHEYYDIAYHGPPRELPSDLHWRVEFLQEELDEYKEALEKGDLAGQFDALLDLVYVAMGTAHLQGFPWQRGWFAVQVANMSKIRARDSEGRGVGDIVKPPGFMPPDIEKLLDYWSKHWDKIQAKG